MKKVTPLFATAYVAINLAIATCGWASDVSGKWEVQYEDNFNYAAQDKSHTTFNTWFWREDSVGRHHFNVVDQSQGCTRENPCVKLTAPKQPKATAYINAEMYNNACVRQGVYQPAEQAFDRLADNPMSQALANYIKRYCDKPYPYREDPAVAGQPKLADDSWNTTTPARLYSNPWAFTSGDAEEPWQAVRDIAFNSLYLADEHSANRMTMTIKAEGEGGGSRGWGYWNTSLDPSLLQLAWFMEYSSQQGSDPKTVKKQVVMQTISFSGNNQIGVCSTVLPNSDYSIYQWHKYRIEWSTQGVNYFVDGDWVASHVEVVPSLGMAFHNWVDNRNYFVKGKEPGNFPLFKEKSNYIKQYRVESLPENQYKMPQGKPAYASKCLSLAADKRLLEILKVLAKDY